MTRDDVAVDAVFDGLSAQSRFLRFHTPTPRLPATTRAALLDVNGHDRVALVAEVRHRGQRQPIGIARLARTGDTEAELAIAVVDAWQGRGVGRRLLEALAAVAADLGFRELHGRVLAENGRMLRLLSGVFPEAQIGWDDGAVLVRCRLGVLEITHDDVLASLVR